MTKWLRALLVVTWFEGFGYVAWGGALFQQQWTAGVFLIGVGIALVALLSMVFHVTAERERTQA